MPTITNVTIEQSSKNIIVDYTETLYDSTGAEAGTQNTRKGFNYLITDDWDSVESDAVLKQYADIAWSGLERPDEETVTEVTT